MDWGQSKRSVRLEAEHRSSRTRENTQVSIENKINCVGGGGGKNKLSRLRKAEVSFMHVCTAHLLKNTLSVLSVERACARCASSCQTLGSVFRLLGGAERKKRAETEERVGNAVDDTKGAQTHISRQRSVALECLKMRVLGSESSASCTNNSLRSRPSTCTHAVDVPSPFRLKRDPTRLKVVSEKRRRRRTNDWRKFWLTN